MDRRRVVVTGMGAMTPLGMNVDEYWTNLLAGKSGISDMTLCDPTGYSCRIAGEVKDFDPVQYVNPKEARRMARFSQLAVAAGLMAAEDSGLDMSKEDRHKVGVILGNGNGGFPEMESGARVVVEKGGMRMSPFFFPMVLPNMAAGNLSRVLGAKGYNSTAITACAASNQAMGEALEAVRRGTADVIFTGGAEAGISQLGLGGFLRNESAERQQRRTSAGQQALRRQTGRVRSRGRSRGAQPWNPWTTPWRETPASCASWRGSDVPPTPTTLFTRKSLATAPSWP